MTRYWNEDHSFILRITEVTSGPGDGLIAVEFVGTPPGNYLEFRRRQSELLKERGLEDPIYSGIPIPKKRPAPARPTASTPKRPKRPAEPMPSTSSGFTGGRVTRSMSGTLPGRPKRLGKEPSSFSAWRSPPPAAGQSYSTHTPTPPSRSSSSQEESDDEDEILALRLQEEERERERLAKVAKENKAKEAKIRALQDADDRAARLRVELERLENQARSDAWKSRLRLRTKGKGKGKRSGGK